MLSRPYSAATALGLADPIRSLRVAIEASDADVIVPFDDRTRHALALLHARLRPAHRVRGPHAGAPRALARVAGQGHLRRTPALQ